LLTKLTKHVFKQFAHTARIVFARVLTNYLVIFDLIDDQNVLIDKVHIFFPPRIQGVIYYFDDELRLSFVSTFN
jgi:hypothetical protein